MKKWGLVPHLCRYIPIKIPTHLFLDIVEFYLPKKGELEEAKLRGIYTKDKDHVARQREDFFQSCRTMSHDVSRSRDTKNTVRVNRPLDTGKGLTIEI
jgi:hypothetical protein